MTLHAPTSLPLRRASRAAWRERAGALASNWRNGTGVSDASAVQLYVFGKHPAWRDFIDPSLLPPTPPAFESFHGAWRGGVESAFCRMPQMPARLALWRNERGSAVLLVLPSHDTPDPFTGQSRPSPLFIGISARAPVRGLLQFAAVRLPRLAAHFQKESRNQEEFLSAIRLAEVAWDLEFDARHDAPAGPNPVNEASTLGGGIADAGTGTCDALFDSAQLWAGVIESVEAENRLMVASANTCFFTPPGGGELAAESVLAAFIASLAISRKPATEAVAKPGSSVPPTSRLPINILPGPLETPANMPVIFSFARGTPIYLAAPAGVGTLHVRLRARRGALRLPRHEGLTFVVGDAGREVIIAEFSGDADAINAAIDGLEFRPLLKHRGKGSIELSIGWQQGTVSKSLHETVSVAVSPPA